jgi:hypothetical protein
LAYKNITLFHAKCSATIQFSSSPWKTILRLLCASFEMIKERNILMIQGFRFFP